jgi:DNA mismatch repair protein MutS2
VIFPPNFEEKIGFDHIRQMLVDMCVSSMGKEYVEKMRFETVFNRIERKVSQVFEFLEILKYEQPFPAQNYFNLIPELQRIRLSGTYILQEQLFDLKSSLESLNEVIVYLQKLDSAKYTLLSELVEDKRVDRVILNEIYSIIDEKGNVKDTASETLRDIRQRLIKLSGEIEKAVRQVLVTAKKSGWLNPNDEITIRNGRMVIPVPAANKRKIRGFVHDESATGQTVYIEPAEALDANNEILELRNAEKREIIRILTSFTDNLRPKIEELIEGYRFLGLIDFIRAKALLAGKINGTKPFMSNEPLIDWRKALHPLLFLVHQKQKKHVEPLDILLNKENRILIISGPNAGGKSVCLKTTGLIQYMLQCGLLVPMDDNSKTGVFKDIFIDIGDEQSIEDDLSTYTSHLRNMKHLALKANKNSLFLIDEFGSGTEPQLGGAIAEAILEHLNNKGAFGVITTHYANLKHLAGKTPGLINGAMLFDTREMRPLYRLQIGNPGSSFAFEIAKKNRIPLVYPSKCRT